MLQDTFAMAEPARRWESLSGLAYLSGMRPGKFLRKQGWNKIKEGVEAMEYGCFLDFSTDSEAFADAYLSCMSCMAGKGRLIERAYRGTGVGVWRLIDDEGITIARSLGWQDDSGKWFFVRCYGEGHYLLDAILTELGCSQRRVPNTRMPKMVPVQETIPVILEVPRFQTVSECGGQPPKYQRVCFAGMSVRESTMVVGSMFMPYLDGWN